MAEITDLLKLNYSQSFDIQGMQEADINLSLSPAVPAAATVYGTVTDGTNPLPNATVKLFDSQGVPYRPSPDGHGGRLCLHQRPRRDLHRSRRLRRTPDEPGRGADAHRRRQPAGAPGLRA